MHHCYLIDPKAPLVFRSGRPFGETGGADTLSFPLPSTIAGALRTAWAESRAEAFDYQARRAEVLRLTVAGPLLARRSLTGGASEALFPRPADVLYLSIDSGVRAYPLRPVALENGSGCNLPAGLCPVFLAASAPQGKPAKDAPAFWTEETMDAWLRGEAPIGDINEHGIGGLPVETRTHVVIDPRTFGIDPGRLFQSGGLDFGPRRNGNSGWDDCDYALLVRSDVDIPPTVRRVGGEGRLARIEAIDGWPRLPQGLGEAIASAGKLRLILATPTVFAGGWRPGWIDPNTLEGTPPGLDGVRLKLAACSLERWQPVSGWDLVEKKPRAVRRLVPAGAVYWFELLEGSAQDLQRLWLHSVSDDEQDRWDGFGLALPGVWTD